MSHEGKLQQRRRLFDSCCANQGHSVPKVTVSACLRQLLACLLAGTQPSEQDMYQETAQQDPTLSLVQMLADYCLCIAGLSAAQFAFLTRTCIRVVKLWAQKLKALACCSARPAQGMKCYNNLACALLH